MHELQNYLGKKVTLVYSKSAIPVVVQGILQKYAFNSDLSVNLHFNPCKPLQTFSNDSCINIQKFTDIISINELLDEPFPTNTVEEINRDLRILTAISDDEVDIDYHGSSYLDKAFQKYVVNNT